MIALGCMAPSPCHLRQLSGVDYTAPPTTSFVLRIPVLHPQPYRVFFLILNWQFAILPEGARFFGLKRDRPARSIYRETARLGRRPETSREREASGLCARRRGPLAFGTDFLVGHGGPATRPTPVVGPSTRQSWESTWVAWSTRVPMRVVGPAYERAVPFRAIRHRYSDARRVVMNHLRCASSWPERLVVHLAPGPAWTCHTRGIVGFADLGDHICTACTHPSVSSSRDG